ncbi:MAG: hypothetical protein OXH86_18275 [Acidimicrobiaceae bacterium]|nr:hypothetical protein [Acidimicrobiaceae bacterium]
MSSRRRGPWGSDIVGVGVCVVLFGLLRGSPLGFTEDPQGFLAFAGIAGGLVGCLQGRPDRHSAPSDSSKRSSTAQGCA